jgi:D-alanyl-D-alanine carboxypeptidase
MVNVENINNSHIETKGESKRRSKTVYLAILITISIIIVVLIIRRMTRPKFTNVGQHLEHIVTEIVNSNKQIKNCVLFVASGDGKFTWSGAAGIANQAGQIPMTKDTPIYLASITKIYISVAVMKLYEQGTLRLDDPISKFLPYDLINGLNVYDGHDYSSEITVEQLLAHTSGIPDYYDEKGKDGKTLFEIFKDDQHKQWRVEDQIIRVRNDLISKSKPGEEAFYSDTNYQLLGKIIEAVTGKPLYTVLDESLFIPLNLRHTWLVGDPTLQEKSSVVIADVFSEDENITKMRSSPFYWADGGIISTTEDEVMFLKALKKGRIIKPATLELMHHWNPIKNIGPFKYGFGTMEFNLPSMVGKVLDTLPVWGHSGSIGSFLYYSPGKDIYVAGTINQTNSNKSAIILMIRAMQVIAHANNL